MTINPYGLHGAPAVGGGLPGLPRRAQPGGKMGITTSQFFIGKTTTSEGVVLPPEGARFMRVAITGGGGRAGAYGGGGGGGCASSLIVPAARVAYSVGPAADNVSLINGADNYAEFPGYILIGRGGKGHDLSESGGEQGIGGMGEGGDFNFKGGNSPQTTVLRSPSGGGGAAGPAGDGADGASRTTEGNTNPGTIPSPDPEAWGDGGGGGGAVVRSSGTASTATCVSGGGGGPGCPGGFAILDIRANAIPGISPRVGRFGGSGQGGAMGASFPSGGNGGVGGGGGGSSSSVSSGGSGGIGMLIVEWFF